MSALEELYKAMKDAHAVALDIYYRVDKEAESCWFIGCKTADEMAEAAAMNAALIETLPDILRDALKERPDEADDAFALAADIVEQTREASERYAQWLGEQSLVGLVKSVWATLVEVLADAAYEVADVVLVVGQRALSGLGWIPWALGVAGIGWAALRARRG